MLIDNVLLVRGGSAFFNPMLDNELCEIVMLVDEMIFGKTRGFSWWLHILECSSVVTESMH